MPNIGSTELLIIMLVIVFLFGAKKIPELMRGVTGAAREFRKGMAPESEKEPPKSTES